MQLKTFEEMKKTSAFFMLKPVNAIYGFIITVCAVILAILIWAIFSPMDDVVKATVLLRPSQAVSSVKFVTSGELSVKNYENDNFVKSGDLLFSLDTTVFESELEAYQTELKKTEDEISIYKTFLQTIKTNEYPALQETENAYLKSAAYLLEKERYETILKDAKIKLKTSIKMSFVTIASLESFKCCNNVFNILRYRRCSSYRICSIRNTMNQGEMNWVITINYWI